MNKHKWMVDVLEDMEAYAAINELVSLKYLLSETRSKFKAEIETSAMSKLQSQNFAPAGRLNLISKSGTETISCKK